MNVAGRAGANPARPLHVDLNFSRASLFACAGVLAALNAQASQILSELTSGPVLDSIANLGGVSAVMWFAMYAALKIGFEAEPRPISRRDMTVVAMVAALVFLPLSLSGHAALLLCALYLQATSRPATPARRIALLLLSLTGPLIWGRILLRLLAGPVLALDAHIVGFIVGTPIDGNTVRFAHSPKEFLIGGPCSSVHNISLAVVLWTTAAVLFRARSDGRYAAYGSSMMALMFMLNIARLCAIALFPASFDFLHIGAGAAMFGWAGLVGAGALAAFGVVDASIRQR